jgi:hypothetical protein
MTCPSPFDLFKIQNGQDGVVRKRKRAKTKKALDPEFGPKTFAVFPLSHFVVLDSGTL